MNFGTFVLFGYFTIVVVVLPKTFSLNSTMFKMTSNISTTSWSYALMSTSMTSTLLDCARLCLLREYCNAFKYEKNVQECQIAKVLWDITYSLDTYTEK